MWSGQFTHVFVVWAVTVLYFPEPHSVHAAEDSPVALNLPAAHAATLVPSPVYPASAKQLARASDPEEVTPVLLGQLLHVSAV